MRWILGVMRSSEGWDNRPVITAPEEKQPSVIRLLGPEVAQIVGVSARMYELFERLQKHHAVSTKIIDWGILENQLWYRREYVSETLAESP